MNEEKFSRESFPISIPSSLQAKTLKFIKLVSYSKKPIETGWSRDRCYDFDDPELLSHLEAGKNYGVRGGDGGLKILDIDDWPRARELGIIEALPETFTVKTPHDGRHYYFICPEIEKKVILYDPEDHKRHIGELQARGQFVVGPTSRLKEGNEKTGEVEVKRWEVEKDLPIATIGKELLEVLEKAWTGARVERQEEKEEGGEKKINRFSHIKIEDIVKPVDIKRDDGVEIQGRHPIHGSANGMNFSVNRRDNSWICYRHMSGGGVLEWIAVEAGIVECGQTKRGWYRGLTRKQKRDLKEALEKRGIVVPSSTINKDAGGLYNQVEKVIERLSFDNEAEGYEVFTFGGRLAKVLRNGDIDILNKDNLAPILDRMMDFIRVNSQGITIRVYPPEKVVLGVLNRNEWPEIPELKGTSKIPIIREDMSICVEPGYDPKTQMYYLGEKIEIPTYSQEEAKRVIGELEDKIFSGFIFSNQASKDNAWFMVFLAMMRHLFNKSPFWYITKPDVSSGASTLSDIPAIICTGEVGDIINKKHEKAEEEKLLQSMLMKGSRFIVVDNVKDVTQEGYNTMGTTEKMAFRPLGKTQMVSVQNNALIVFNGINLSFTDDTARRGLITELEPNKDFLNGIEDIRKTIKREREWIVKGLLGVIKSWADAGRPGEAEYIPQLISYMDCINIINPILKYVGINEALTNAEVAKEEFDPDREEFDEFIQAWATVLGDKKVYNSDILDELEKIPKEYLPSKVRRGLAEGDIKEISYYLRGHKGKTYSGGLKIEKGHVKEKRYWRVSGGISAEKQDEERQGHFEEMKEKVLKG